MDRSEVIFLIKQEYTQDEYGVIDSENTEKQVYCDVSSISASELFEGGRNGLNPELKFIMFRYDYDDESIVKYKGKFYSIYRTYIGKNETIELYCEKRKGTSHE